jgi:hypothetical protein
MSPDQKEDQIEHIDMASVDNKTDPKYPPIDDAWKAREKRLVRKLDMTLMPMVWVLYLFNYLDRNNIALVSS